MLILSIWVCLRNDAAIPSKSSSYRRVREGVNSLSAGGEIKFLDLLQCKTWQARCRGKKQKVKVDDAEFFSHANPAPILIQQPGTTGAFFALSIVLGKYSNLLIPGGWDPAQMSLYTHVISWRTGQWSAAATGAAKSISRKQKKKS